MESAGTTWNGASTITVVGAGAVGGLLGARFVMAGHSVTLIDRDEQLAALQEYGLVLHDLDGRRHQITGFCATEDFTSPGVQDVVVLAVKAHQIVSVASLLPALFGEDTTVLTLQNGIPWWYFQKHGGPHDGHRLQSLDPDGVIEDHIPAQRIVGAIVYPAAAVEEPGVIRHIEGDRIPIGELEGGESERTRYLADILRSAGFRTRILDDVRAETWLKAIGNLAFNPISALTRASMAEICRFPLTRNLAARMMQEALDVAGRLDVTVRKTIEERLRGSERVGDHKTSMLQDVEAGRPLEIAGLIGSILELAALTGTPTPVIEAIHACCAQLDESITAPTGPAPR